MNFTSLYFSDNHQHKSKLKTTFFIKKQKLKNQQKFEQKLFSLVKKDQF